MAIQRITHAAATAPFVVALTTSFMFLRPMLAVLLAAASFFPFAGRRMLRHHWLNIQPQ